MLCGRTSAVEAAVSLHGRCYRNNAAGAERQRPFGCISLPLPRSVGRAGNAPVGGGPKLGGHYSTLGNCRRVPRRQFRATCETSGWMGCGAPVNRRWPCPYCYDGRLWTVTRQFFGCGITGDLVGRLRALGIVLLDQM